MDIFQEVLSQQNILLLSRIANDKFTHDKDKIKFIKKYNKYNYQKLKITKENRIKSYKKRIKRMKGDESQPIE